MVQFPLAPPPPPFLAVSLESSDPLSPAATPAPAPLLPAPGPDGCAAAVSSFLAAAGDMQALVDTLLVGVTAEELQGERAEGTHTGLGT